MGLLDSVLGSLMGGGGNTSPMASILQGLLSGQQGGQQGAQQGGVPQGAAQPAPGLAGGLGGLISAFQSAGLGQIAQSWISNGPNQSVSPAQLSSVFGQNQVNSMASQAGMAPHDFLSQLSQHLPQAVDGMTPNGHANEGTMSV